MNVIKITRGGDSQESEYVEVVAQVPTVDSLEGAKIFMMEVDSDLVVTSDVDLGLALCLDAPVPPLLDPLVLRGDREFTETDPVWYGHESRGESRE